MILGSLGLYSQILNKKNSIITKCEDSLAKCFAISGKTIIKKVDNYNFEINVSCGVKCGFLVTSIVMKFIDQFSNI